jgi:hypothetical protein
VIEVTPAGTSQKPEPVSGTPLKGCAKAEDATTIADAAKAVIRGKLRVNKIMRIPEFENKQDSVFIDWNRSGLCLGEGDMKQSNEIGLAFEFTKIRSSFRLPYFS